MAVKNKYQIERKYVTNKLARSGAKLSKVRYLVAHETANNTANADAHYRYFQNITFSASAHTFIDGMKILEIIPLDEKAWHVQYQQDRKTLGLGAANDFAIGTELCRTGNFREAYDKFVWYHAYLCKKFGLNPLKHITAHKFEDPQRRNDPQSWLEPNGVKWEQFIKDVKKYYDEWDGVPVVVTPPSKTETKPVANAPKPAPTPTKPKPTKLYRVQIGAFSKKANADAEAAKAKRAGYSPYIAKDGALFKVQIGAYSVKANADKVAAELKRKGFNVYIA